MRAKMKTDNSNREIAIEILKEELELGNDRGSMDITITDTTSHIVIESSLDDLHSRVDKIVSNYKFINIE